MVYYGWSEGQMALFPTQKNMETSQNKKEMKMHVDVPVLMVVS